VKIRFYGKEVALVICIVILIPAVAFAAEGNVISIQGRVMSLDLSRNRMVISEQIFVWDVSSLLFDEKGSAIPITADRLKKGTWVSVEATARKNRPHLIRTISLLRK
jgi:hypothetical protein